MLPPRSGRCSHGCTAQDLLAQAQARGSTTQGLDPAWTPGTGAFRPHHPAPRGPRTSTAEAGLACTTSNYVKQLP